MEYTPRYAQPFTLREAVGLDVSLITEEIARLQNSLQKLKETQDLLRDHIEHSETDSEISQAFQENTAVIGSQQERISILKMALEEKGVFSGEHYELQPAPDVASRNSNGGPGPMPAAPGGSAQAWDHTEDGVYL